MEELQIWGRVRSLLHQKSPHTAQALVITLESWPRPLIQAAELRPDSRYESPPELSLWFNPGYLDLVFWGDKGCSPLQLISLFEMLWQFTRTESPVPTLSHGPAKSFESCWTFFAQLRQRWDSAVT